MSLPHTFATQYPSVSLKYLDDNFGQLDTALSAPSGTRMLFQQTTAPTGWTKDTTAAYNDNALRIVTGTVGSGGTVAFSTAFNASNTVDGHSVTQAELPNVNFSVTDPGHVHNENVSVGPAGITPAYRNGGAGGNYVPNNVGTTDTSSGRLPTDTATIGITVSSGGSGTAHNHTLANLAVKYVDMIIASKD